MILPELSNLRYVMVISDSKINLDFDSQFADVVWITMVLGDSKNLLYETNISDLEE